MSICDSDSGLSISLDGSHYGSSVTTSNGVTYFKLEIKVPDLNLKKSLSVGITETVAVLKKNVITTLSTDLKDAMNYGIFIPPTDGKAGKFLLEERTLSDYGLHQGHQIVELRYKRRLYRGSNINVAKLKKLHSKANLKLFMDYVGNADVSKIAKLLHKGMDPNFQIKETGETPLIKACSLSQPIEIIKILVEGGAHLDYRHSNGHTPLHAASILGNLEAVKVLLDLGQSPNTIDLEGLTPLYHSIISDPAAVCVERLLYDYSVIGVEDENGLQEIHQACRFGRTQHLEYLLQYKADINSQTSKNGNTPLHICAYLNQESCARLLLFRGADRTVKNRAGHTAYQQALLSDNKNIAMLIQYYKDEDVVCVRGSPKYNDKRRPSLTPCHMMQRSRSTSRLMDSAQLDKQMTSLPEHLRSQPRSLGKSGGQTVSNCLNEPENDMENYQDSSFDTRILSRSVSNLPQMPAQNGQVPVDTKDSVSTSMSDWWLDWENDDTDGLSSVSGPSQRRTARTQSRQGTSKKSRSQSCKRRLSKPDLAGLAEIDTNFLPRVVVLQRNSQGFGFVIRGLKASSTINFRPTLKNPALQYFEEVEVNSVAARAGLKKGDFILEINGQSVVAASHEETVRLIKASGDILALKVVTVNTNNPNDQRKCFDLAMSGMDDYSDQSSIISSEVLSQRLSTFARSLTRPIPSSTSTPNNFGNLSSTYIPMPFVRCPVPTDSSMTTVSLFQNSGSMNQCKSIFDSVSLVSNDQISPLALYSPGGQILSPHLRVRRNTIATNTVRPDSILSTDSFYPMPPPPIGEFSPNKPMEKLVDEDFTLKRTKTYPAPASFSDSNGNSSMAVSNADTKIVNSIAIPPPPRCTSPLATQILAPLPPPASIAAVPPCGQAPQAPPAPPPPPPPPPPPCGPPQLTSAPPPAMLLSNIPKPILKQPKPIPKPSNFSQPVQFDSNLRQAIAKRRQQIDNDQNSVASFDMVGGCSDTVGRTNSSAWTNASERDMDSAMFNGNNPFQRTRSDIYSTNTATSSMRKNEENASRLYLV